VRSGLEGCASVALRGACCGGWVDSHWVCIGGGVYVVVWGGPSLGAPSVWLARPTSGEPCFFLGEHLVGVVVLGWVVSARCGGVGWYDYRRREGPASWWGVMRVGVVWGWDYASDGRRRLRVALFRFLAGPSVGEVASAVWGVAWGSWVLRAFACARLPVVRPCVGGGVGSWPGGYGGAAGSVGVRGTRLGTVGVADGSCRCA